MATHRWPRPASQEDALVERSTCSTPAARAPFGLRAPPGVLVAEERNSWMMKQLLATAGRLPQSPADALLVAVCLGVRWAGSRELEAPAMRLTLRPGRHRAHASPRSGQLGSGGERATGSLSSPRVVNAPLRSIAVKSRNALSGGRKKKRAAGYSGRPWKTAPPQGRKAAGQGQAWDAEGPRSRFGRGRGRA